MADIVITLEPLAPKNQELLHTHFGEFRIEPVSAETLVTAADVFGDNPIILFSDGIDFLARLLQKNPSRRYPGVFLLYWPNESDTVIKLLGSNLDGDRFRLLKIPGPNESLEFWEEFRSMLRWALTDTTAGAILESPKYSSYWETPDDTAADVGGIDRGSRTNCIELPEAEPSRTRATRGIGLPTGPLVMIVLLAALIFAGLVWL